MLEFLREYQLNIMLILIGVCGLLAFLVLITRAIPLKRRFILMGMELCAMFLLIADRYAYIYRGDASDMGYWMVRICNFSVYLMTLLIIEIFNLYLGNLCINEVGLKELPKRMRIAHILAAIDLVLLILGAVFGWFYTFNENNEYVRAPGFFISYIIPLTIHLLLLTVICQYRSRLSKGVRLSLILFTVVPFLASLLQIYAYGLSLTNMTMVGLVVLLYIFSLLDMNDAVEHAREIEIKVIREEQKNAEMIFEQTALALAGAIDAKDKYTHGHSLRVAEYSRAIAKASGKDDRECREIYYTALLHDVGKIGIADVIINKEGKLTKEEFDKIKEHPVIGKRILSSISRLPYLSIGANYHHERYDGKGYPEMLKGEDIPAIARIIAVADAYDAMSSKRSYRDPLPQQKVREELVKGIGTQFDPEFAREMLHLIDVDTEYEMQEREEVTHLEGRNEVEVEEYRSAISEGILLSEYSTLIRLRVKEDEEYKRKGKTGMPAVLLFDSLDARAHFADNKKDEMLYLEYAELRPDGRCSCIGARKVQESKISDRSVYADIDRTKDDDYVIEAVKCEDHVRVKIASETDAWEYTVALQDCSRYCYLGITGEYCNIVINEVTKSETPIAEGDIPRLVEKISYIDVPEGDIPNVQINGWRTAASEPLPVKNEMNITFHTMSLPTSRLVWHCPSLFFFTGLDGKVDGEGYRELCLIRMDGESWKGDDAVDNSILTNKADDFDGWESWKANNKKGLDCSIHIKRNNNRIVVTTENSGIQIKNTIDINDDTVENIYVALSGDQCALTNIKIKQV